MGPNLAPGGECGIEMASISRAEISRVRWNSRMSLSKLGGSLEYSFYTSGIGSQEKCRSR